MPRPVPVPTLVLTLVLALVLLPAGGCATTPHPLLQEDHRAMSDPGILRYYYDLEAAIAECEGNGPDGPTVGVGGTTGSYGSGVGVGVGLPLGTGCDSSALRQRQAEVRAALHQRGLQP